MNIIRLEDVKIPLCYTKTKPRPEKVNAVLSYVKKNNELDRPLVLDKDNNLTDGYIRYLVAQEIGLEVVSYLTQEEYQNQRKKIRENMQYIVGIFYKCKKEYTWKNPNKIPVKIGDRVLVHSKDKWGNKRNTAVVTVVNVYESDTPDLLKHKNIIAVFPKEDGERMNV